MSTTAEGTTTGTLPVTDGGHVLRSPRTAPPGLLRCGIVSWHPWRGECLRVAAEQEIWQAIVCKDAKELRQNIFRDGIPLTIVDLPQISSEPYASYREQTEWLSKLGSWNGSSGMLLVVCAAGESVQEEIWARQLGVWSYLPLVKLPTLDLTAPKKQGPVSPFQDGLSLLFSGAREALGNLTRDFGKTIVGEGQ